MTGRLIRVFCLGLRASGGQHWVAWLLLSPTVSEFFDSYGYGYETYSHLIAPTDTIIRENCIKLQNDITYFCGQYSLMFVYERSRGISYEDFMDNFSLNTSYNDWFVATYVNNLLTFRPYHNYNSSGNVLGCKRQCEVNKCL